jgi:hypothetical protein
LVNQVQVPHSVVAGKQPQPVDVIEGGLALNLKDGTLYSKGYDGVIIRLTGVMAVDNDEATNATVYLPWVTATGKAVRAYTSSSKLSFNPSTGQLRATSFAGSGAGLTGFTAQQITSALGFSPAKSSGTALPPPATDLPTAITLLNAIRSVLVGSGIGT